MASTVAEEEEEAEAAWRTSGPRLGKRLVRTFGGVESCGTVVGWIPAKENSGTALWHVLHDDGDREDLEKTEVMQAIADCAGGAAARGDAASTSSKRSADAPGPFQVGDRVEARFDAGLVFFAGMLDGRCDERDGGPCSYSIRYDDGDREVGVSPHLMRHEAGAKTKRKRRMEAKARIGAEGGACRDIEIAYDEAVINGGGRSATQRETGGEPAQEAAGPSKQRRRG